MASVVSVSSQSKLLPQQRAWWWGGPSSPRVNSKQCWPNHTTTWTGQLCRRGNSRGSRKCCGSCSGCCSLSWPVAILSCNTQHHHLCDSFWKLLYYQSWPQDRGPMNLSLSGRDRRTLGSSDNYLNFCYSPRQLCMADTVSAWGHWSSDASIRASQPCTNFSP